MDCSGSGHSYDTHVENSGQNYSVKDSGHNEVDELMIVVTIKSLKLLKHQVWKVSFVMMPSLMMKKHTCVISG